MQKVKTNKEISVPDFSAGCLVSAALNNQFLKVGEWHLDLATDNKVGKGFITLAINRDTKVATFYINVADLPKIIHRPECLKELIFG